MDRAGPSRGAYATDENQRPSHTPFDPDQEWSMHTPSSSFTKKSATGADLARTLLPMSPSKSGVERGGSASADWLCLDLYRVLTPVTKFLRIPSRVLRSFHRLILVMTHSPFLSSVIAACVGMLVALLCTSLVAHVRHVQDPDKSLLPWREYCAVRPPFVNADVASIHPVSLLVGVVTVDHKFARRQVIRSTYASLTMPTHPQTGHPLSHVQVNFILGRPKKEYADRIALEMEMYNDIVILDMKETQWSHKTYEFLRWASENATVPVLVPRSTPAVHTIPAGDSWKEYEVRWKLVDYVIKADDDAFIVLDELERRLRSLPRQLLHWGYKVKDQFMSGETYALSHDLVQFLASSPTVAQWPSLKEDEQVAQWLALHPNKEDITWASEPCWIYDHPRAPTPYAHGFLFPDEVERIKHEYMTGLSTAEIERRGGLSKAWSYSTTSQWGRAYTPPKPDLSVEERVEALVEGGGRWAGHWYRMSHEIDTPHLFSREDVVLRPQEMRHDPEQAHTDRAFDAHWGLPLYPAAPTRLGQAMHAPLMPEPWGPTVEGVSDELRRQRTLNGTLGGTVVVHYLKQDQWFYETALALLGRTRTWQHGSAANQWRMDHSPVVEPYSSTHARIGQRALRSSI